jgi:hypothetical protein
VTVEDTPGEGARLDTLLAFPLAIGGKSVSAVCELLLPVPPLHSAFRHDIWRADKNGMHKPPSPFNVS